MEEFFKFLGEELLDKHPVATGIAIFLLCLSALFLYMFKKTISSKIKNFRFNGIGSSKPKNKISKLAFHRFFNVCDQVERKILSMSFITHGEIDRIKTKMMHKLIQLKCVSMKKRFSELLLSKDIDSWDAYKLQHKFKSTLMEVVEEYNHQALMLYIEWGISQEDAKFLIETYEDYRYTMVEGFVDSVDSVLMNNDYSNNFDKVNTLMELCSLAIHVIPRDVRSSFEAVNGRFAKYKNLMI